MKKPFYELAHGVTHSRDAGAAGSAPALPLQNFKQRTGPCPHLPRHGRAVRRAATRSHSVFS